MLKSENKESILVLGLWFWFIMTYMLLVFIGCPRLWQLAVDARRKFSYPFSLPGEYASPLIKWAISILISFESQTSPLYRLAAENTSVIKKKCRKRNGKKNVLWDEKNNIHSKWFSLFEKMYFDRSFINFATAPGILIRACAERTFSFSIMHALVFVSDWKIVRIVGWWNVSVVW